MQKREQFIKCHFKMHFNWSKVNILFPITQYIDAESPLRIIRWPVAYHLCYWFLYSISNRHMSNMASHWSKCIDKIGNVKVIISGSSLNVSFWLLFWQMWSNSRLVATNWSPISSRVNTKMAVPRRYIRPEIVSRNHWSWECREFSWISLAILNNNV